MRMKTSQMAIRNRQTQHVPSREPQPGPAAVRAWTVDAIEIWAAMSLVDTQHGLYIRAPGMNIRFQP